MAHLVAINDEVMAGKRVAGDGMRSRSILWRAHPLAGRLAKY
jgi:hypothetical protein